MGTIARPAASVAAFAFLLVGIGVAWPIDSTRAGDACATAPGAAAPAGQHWYYRIDRATHRKCWFMHAIAPLSAGTAAEPPDAASTPAHAAATSQRPSAAAPQAARAVAAPLAPADTSPADTSEPSSAETSNAANEATGTLPAPHITVLNVKPGPAPFAGTPSPSPMAAPEPTAQAPMPQLPPDHAAMGGKGDLRPPKFADPVPAPDASDAAADALPQAHDAASASAPARSDLFFVLDLALGLAAALIVLVGKMAGFLRTPRLSDHPDDVWRRRVIYQDNSPSLVPQAPQGPADLDMLKAVRRSPPVQADFPAARPVMERPGSRSRMNPAAKGSELELRPTRPARRSGSRA